VTWMSAAAGMAGRWRRACWFFSSAVWDIDDLGVAVARLVVKYLLSDADPIVVAVDGTFFKRWGKEVFQARWAYDGSAQGGKKIAFGNTWVICAIVVRLKFCPSPVALPALFRLWRGKGTASQVQLAAQMLKLLAAAFPGRKIHGVGDAAFHGGPLVIEGVTWTTRLPSNGVLWEPAPPRTGKRGAPRKKGGRLGTCAEITAAAGTTWREMTVSTYGKDSTVCVTDAQALWHGSFGTAPGRVVIVKDPSSKKAYDLGLFTLDPAADPAAIIERYSLRWAIEPSNATGKQIVGAGGACNRTQKSAERTVPSGFLIQTLLISWYSRFADSPADVTRRRQLCPWYQAKTTPAPADMLTALRDAFAQARINAMWPGQSRPEQNIRSALTCDATAA
ncbi:MAG: IS701 family transposase, partial [Mycobacterium sp.]